MKQFIAVFFVHTSSGLPVAVWMHHNPHPQGWGFHFNHFNNLKPSVGFVKTF
jgi:hypothetical protein